MFLRVDLEATGEEAVRIHVSDSSEEILTTEMIRHRGIDSGLGLVVSAIGRYDGAVQVDPGTGGYSKTVMVRFFRAFEENEH